MSREKVKTAIKFVGHTVYFFWYTLLFLAESPIWVAFFLWGFMVAPWDWANEKDSSDSYFHWHPAYKFLDWLFPESPEPTMSREDAEMCRTVERALDGTTYTKLPNED